ncbi:hypothetical protein [Nannocystis punicea]|uniref:Uncharacterized protein n=1 Tax=Nannocystis punicea TaxID=2995304 RepID=A0ABY7H0M4_9BACT|nr:hypothetical protein [Nannocystis poenicansa]WAS92783.1 hypothetical protein O0S08_41945 [Nannocystis poenicansa]
MTLRSLAFALALGSSDEPARALAEGRFTDAAQAIETSATQDSEMLWTAAEIRTGLGQPELAEADLSASERIAGQRSSADAAAAFWRRRALLWTWEQRLEHMRTYLRRHARHGGLARRIVAEATIAQFLWLLSCKGSVSHGVCAEFDVQVRRRARDTGWPRRPWADKSKKAVPAKLGPIFVHCDITFGRVQGSEREPRGSAAARAQLRRVVTLARKADSAVLSEPEVAAAVLAAELSLLDTSLEAYLMKHVGEPRLYPDRWLANSQAPADIRELGRQRREVARAERELADTNRALATEGAALRKRYEEFALRAGSGRIARDAWFRVALVSQHHAAELGGARPRGGFPSGEEALRWCDESSARVAPLRQAAREAYARCLSDATARGEFDAGVEVCEQVLVEYWPKDYPAPAELVGRPGLLASAPQSIGFILEPPLE